MCMIKLLKDHFKSTYLGGVVSWWRRQMETFSSLLALCEGNPPVTGGFPSQRPVTRGFGVFFDVQWTNDWTHSPDAGDLWRHYAHCDVTVMVSWTLEMTMLRRCLRYNSKIWA